MNWYLAKLIYRILYNEGNHTAQFNEQLRLVFAEDSLHAFHKARLIGERETISFGDIDKLVTWKFIDVSELFPLTKLTDGAEVWSEINEEDNAEMYIRSIQKRAGGLLDEGIHQFSSLNSSGIGA